MEDTGGSQGPDSTAGTPRWVKVFAVIALIVILLVVVLMILGGGQHGPSRHMRRSDTSEQASPQSGRS